MQKNAKTGEESILFDSIAAMSNMKMPTFRNDKVSERATRSQPKHTHIPTRLKIMEEYIHIYNKSGAMIYPCAYTSLANGLIDPVNCVCDDACEWQDDIESTETLGVWKAVMAGITRRDWEMARRAKHEVEERQRVLAKQRKAQGIAWTPKHFVEAEEDGQWQWKHSSMRVPQAPILIPS
jgi:hypothetical protein